MKFEARWYDISHHMLENETLDFVRNNFPYFAKRQHAIWKLLNVPIPVIKKQPLTIPRNAIYANIFVHWVPNAFGVYFNDFYIKLNVYQYFT